MTSSCRIERVLEVKASVGECPAWSVEDQALYWVDIHKRTFNRFDPATGVNRAWALPSMPGCFGLREGNGAIIAAGDGVYDFDFASGALERLFDAPFDPRTHRFNDGKPDRRGRLWAGSIDSESVRSGAENGGVIYRLDAAGFVPVIQPVTVANGTAFSPDGRTMYRAESRHRVIYALDYDPDTGTPSRQRVFARVPETLGVPDGAAVDEEGGYWVALPFGPSGGAICRFAPDGELDFHIAMPVSMPTMVAFGGARMSTLFVTSGSDSQWSNAPLGEFAGDVFAVETRFRGIPETRVADMRGASTQRTITPPDAH